MPRELRHSSPKPKPILPARGFQGLGGLCRKDNSSQRFEGRLLVASRCHDRHEVRTVPLPGSGIWTGFPFAFNLVSPSFEREREASEHPPDRGGNPRRPPPSATPKGRAKKGEGREADLPVRRYVRDRQRRRVKPPNGQRPTISTPSAIPGTDQLKGRNRRRTDEDRPRPRASNASNSFFRLHISTNV